LVAYDAAPSTYKIPPSMIARRIPHRAFENQNREDTIFRSKAVANHRCCWLFSAFFAIRDAVASVGGYRTNPPLNARHRRSWLRLMQRAGGSMTRWVRICAGPRPRTVGSPGDGRVDAARRPRRKRMIVTPHQAVGTIGGIS
jgi:hypothetical protein